MATREVKKEFKKRGNLFLLIPVYFTVYILFIDFSDFRKIVFELENKKSFYSKTFKIDSIYSGYGAARGALFITIDDRGCKKNVLYSFIGNGIVPGKYNNADSVKVLVSPLIKDYVFIYEEFFLTKRLIYLIFQAFILFVGFVFFYYVRKQHKIVKQLAPYGVDKDYNPLPKPEEKFNFNKYD